MAEKTEQPQRSRLTYLVVFGLAILFVILLFGVLYLLLQIAFPAHSPLPAPPAAITVIAAPSATIIPMATMTAGPTPTFTPVPSGSMGIGAYIQISGTGGDGLRLRARPGKSFDPVFLGGESEVFKVTDGPKQADGFTWWFLVAPYDDQRKGWAVENYLSVVPNQNEVTPKP
jgi:hypothetical protein